MEHTGPAGGPKTERAERRVLAMLDTIPKHLRDDTRCWVAALRGEGRRPSPPLQWPSIEVYVSTAAPILHQWAESYESLRQVTRADIETAIRDRGHHSPHNVHTALRSLFRGLKREQRVFTDPADGIVAHFARRLPRPIQARRLLGLLDRLDHPRERLIVALVAVHALTVAELQALQLHDVDRDRGTVHVRRRANVFTPVLDEMTTEMVNQWLRTRATRWPHTTNPHLFVTGHTVLAREPMSRYGLTTAFRRVGISAQELRTDRILDEACHTADPVQLIRVFGLGVTTAVRYVHAAHPERFQADFAAP